MCEKYIIKSYACIKTTGWGTRFLNLFTTTTALILKIFYSNFDLKERIKMRPDISIKSFHNTRRTFNKTLYVYLSVLSISTMKNENLTISLFTWSSITSTSSTSHYYAQSNSKREFFTMTHLTHHYGILFFRQFHEFMLGSIEWIKN